MASCLARSLVVNDSGVLCSTTSTTEVSPLRYAITTVNHELRCRGFTLANEGDL